MNRTLHKRVLKLQEINQKAKADPKAFIEEEEVRYRNDIAGLADMLDNDMDDRCLVLLAGPSSSGKTTTAHILKDDLVANGVDAHVVSLDDFYRGREQAPRLEDGSFDYESLDALDLKTLRSCMRELLQDGYTQLPIFDFVTGAPTQEKKELKISHHSAVIFEGIHALNPIFEQQLPQENLYKVFINTMSAVYDGEMKLLARRQLRLTRRLLRDVRFRNSSAENTLKMWQQVVRGENKYLFPYVDTVDFAVDTTHGYEPCIFAAELVNLLKTLPQDDPFRATASQLQAALSMFEPIPLTMMPEKSMLREFVGNSEGHEVL